MSDSSINSNFGKWGHIHNTKLSQRCKVIFLNKLGRQTYSKSGMYGVPILGFNDCPTPCHVGNCTERESLLYRSCRSLLALRDRLENEPNNRQRGIWLALVSQICNWISTIWNLKPELDKLKSTTWNRQFKIDNSKSTTRNRQLEIDNSKSTTWSRNL